MYWPQHNPSTTIKLASFWPIAVKGDGGRIALLQQHEAVRWAYNTDMQLIDKPDEILIPEDFLVVSVEEASEHTQSLPDLKHPEKGLYITGNDNFRRPSEHMMTHYRVHIPVPSNGEHPLYSHQAWSIVMHDRYSKEAKPPVLKDIGEDGRHWWRIEDNGKPVAFCSADQRTRGCWYIGSSFTEPSHRRKGYNRMLSEARLAFIETQDPLVVIALNNKDSLPVNQAQGFEELESFEDQGYKEWVMVKDYT